MSLKREAPSHWPSSGVIEKSGTGMLTEAPRHALSVSDVERLAKAGVSINISDIAQQLVPDPPPTPSHVFDTAAVSTLVKRLATISAFNDNFNQFMDGSGFLLRKYVSLAASLHGDKVYVFVHMRGIEPLIIEDAKHLYPSDALIAKLTLLSQTAETANVGSASA